MGTIVWQAYHFKYIVLKTYFMTGGLNKFGKKIVTISPDLSDLIIFTVWFGYNQNIKSEQYTPMLEVFVVVHVVSKHLYGCYLSGACVHCIFDIALYCNIKHCCGSHYIRDSLGS
jgi:hypothetical protein